MKFYKLTTGFKILDNGIIKKEIVRKHTMIVLYIIIENRFIIWHNLRWFYSKFGLVLISCPETVALFLS